jgi:hypothetical protein
MTDDTKVPPGFEPDADGEHVQPSVALQAACIELRPEQSRADAWAWRERVAAALGLVDQGVSFVPVLTLETTGGNIDELLTDRRLGWSDRPIRPAVTVSIGESPNKAIAAELRRLADTLAPGHDLVFPDGSVDCHAGDVQDWLRARADELDPPTGG